jgi:hypothetical protein
MSHIDNGVIRLYSHSGLCNRLRLFSSYMNLAEKIDHKIEMHWVLCVQCWASFDALFKPIPNVNFIYSRHGKNARKSRPANSAISLNDIKEQEICNYYQAIKPIPSIQKEIDTLKKRLGDDFSSCHVRRGDILTVQKKYDKKPNTNEEFFEFLENTDSRKYFIATDNKEAQEIFKDRYKDKVIFSSTISKKSCTRWPRRTTSIQNAVIDLFTCIDSKHFTGTVCSSFTQFIYRYRKGLKCQN